MDNIIDILVKIFREAHISYAFKKQIEKKLLKNK